MLYIIAVILLALPPVGWKGEEKMPLAASAAEALVDSIGREYYEAKFALYPAYATSKGIHTHDTDLSTFSRRNVNAFLRRIMRLETGLQSFYEDSLGIGAWIDLKALLAETATQRLLLEDFDLWHRSPILYSDACIDGIYYLLTRLDGPDLGAALAARLKRIPEVTASGRANLTQPISLHCEVASQSIKDFLPFLADLGPQGDKDLSVDPALIRQAHESLSKFAAYLDSLAPIGDPYFHLGRENLIKLLHTRHLVDDSPEDLVAYAEQVLTEAQVRWWEYSDQESGAAIDTSQAGLPGGVDLKTHLRAEIESAQVFLRRNDLVTLPVEHTLRVVETPSFLLNLIPGFAYEPAGPFDDSQAGLFYVPPVDLGGTADSLGYARKMIRRGWRGAVVHETFPGHHMQITVANSHPSYIRRLQDDLFTMEGWALYCEEMMALQGYSGQGGMGATLGGIVFRAARVIVDVKMQLGEFSLDEAVDFMVKETGAPRGFLEKEVKRYAIRPTQAMSYLIGKREILGLKDEIRGIMGDSFTLKRFHDNVLSCGSVPPYLLKTCVISAVVGRT